MPQAVNEPYRQDLDGLRGLAIAAVLLFHLFPDQLPGGFVGVDVFFVVSGFVITRNLQRRLEAGTFSFRDFFTRRVRRLFPALLAVLFVVGLVGAAVLLPGEFGALGKHLVGALTFTPNVVTWREGGYFGTLALSKPLHHLWSLGVEEQFYVLWPLVLWVGHRARRARRFLFAALLVGSFAANLWLTLEDPDGAFFLPFGRLWQLGVGATLALWTPSSRFAVSRSLIGLGLVLAGVALTSAQGYPGLHALVPTLGTAAVISASEDTWVNRRVLAGRPLVALGLISYPLYLWHWPVLVFTRLLAGVRDEAKGALVLPLGATVLVAGASLVLAALTTRFIEFPIRREGRVASRTLLWAHGALGVTALGIAFAVIPPRSGRTPLDRLAEIQAHFTYPTASLQPFAFHGRTFHHVGALPPQVLFIGDSNMEQYAPALETRLAEGPTVPYAFVTQRGCAPFVVLDGHPCPAFAEAMHALADEPSVTTVVIAADWALYFSDPRFSVNARRLSLDDGEQASRVFEGFETWLVELRAKGKLVVLVKNIPELPPLDVARRVERSLLSGSRLDTTPLPRQALEAQLAPVTRWLTELGRRVGARLIDPFDVMCATDTCPVVTSEGLPIYLDAHHLRPFYVARTFRVFDDLVDAREATPFAP